MMRANPKTFCTKWLDESNAMTDEEHAAEDLKSHNRHQLAWFCNANPEYAKFLARKRDKMPRAEFFFGPKPFSLWAK
jgi:hypothetical protein